MPSTIKHKQKQARVLKKTLSVSLVSLGILSIFCGILTSIDGAKFVSAVSGTDSVSATQDVTVTLGASILMHILDSTATTEISGITLDLVPTAVGVTTSESVVVDVATSNAAGYTLYMNSDFTDGGTYTTNLVSPVGAIPTSTTLKNAWNYGTEWNETIGGESYSGSTTNQAIPPITSPATLRNDVTKATSSSKTTVAFNVNADTSIPAGVYKNKLVFTAVATSAYVGYNLYFNDNGGSGGPESLTSSSVGSTYTFTIPDTVPTKQGKKFLGWSESPSATEADYAVGDEYTIVASGTPPYSATLYAVWADAIPFYNITTMQQMTPQVCASVHTPNVTNATTTIITSTEDAYDASNLNQVPRIQLTDERDGNSYVVTKLADGNCWMTSNLKYTLTANTDAIGVDHASNNTFTFNTGAACSGNGNCIMNANTKMTQNYDGFYYSWYAATAGTGTASMASGDATGSICPKGWRLPANYTSDSNKSYGSITDKYLGFHVNTSGDYTAKMEGLPLQFLRAGDYNGGTFYYGGTAGDYWSSTASTAANGYDLVYVTSSTYPQTSDAKYVGFSVRCVAQ